MKTVSAILTAAALLAVAGPAHAVVVHNDGANNPTGQYRPTNSSLSVNINSPAGGLTGISFDLFGAMSLDGVNFYEDDFTFSVNGADQLSLSYDLGGGGTNSVFLNNGFTIGGGTFGFFGGGTLNIAGSILLNAGLNVLTFSYVSLGAGHAGFQGTADESWAVNNVDVALTPVPLPASAPLLALGLAGLIALRRKTCVA